MPAEETPRDAERLRDLLSHPDPPSLWYQLGEIVDDRIYVRHGIGVGPGDVVFDVGANVGVAAAFFAEVCAVERVHCFEPITQICALLRRNVGQFPACFVHEAGLSATSGSAELTYYENASAMSGVYASPDEDRELVRRALVNRGVPEGEAGARVRESFEPTPVTCRMLTLSDALAELDVERIDLLKIDVEKAELDVLSGLAPDDWRRVRQVAMESHDAGGRSEAAAAMLSGRGFRVSVDRDARMRDTGLSMIYATRT